MSKPVNYRARLRASVVLPLAAVAVLAAGGASPALAKKASYEVLHNFTGGANDGSLPQANLMRDKSGNLYGTTSTGGAAGDGTVFKITTSGTETVLYSFEGSPDGSYPGYGTLIEDSAGNLYGTTYLGGADDFGTVFKVTPDGTETTLHSFTGGTDAEYPLGGMIADSRGNLYGTSTYGGTYGNGTVFELAPDGTETVLYSFDNLPDGAAPQDSLLSIAGNLYGETTAGGANGYGTVFDLVKGKKGAWTENVLLSFGGQDGQNPRSDLTKDSAGNLYGTTVYGGGGGGYGVVFELAPDGTFTVLHSFNGGSDGEDPYSAVLTAKNGDLYGTTNTNGINGAYGTVFQLAPDGTETVLHGFAGPPNDGDLPLGAGTLTKIGDYLYGTTSAGGTNNLGTVFRIKK